MALEEEWKLRLTLAKVEIEVEADLGKTKKKGANIPEQGGRCHFIGEFHINPNKIIFNANNFLVFCLLADWENG